MDQNWHFLTTYPRHLVHVVFEVSITYFCLAFKTDKIEQANGCQIVQKLRGQNEGGRWSKMPIIVHTQGEKCPRGGR